MGGNHWDDNPEYGEHDEPSQCGQLVAEAAIAISIVLAVVAIWKLVRRGLG